MKDQLVRFYRAGLFIALTIVAMGFVSSAHSQVKVKSEHGDWRLHCETPSGARREQCALIQKVTAEDRENVGLNVLVVKTADNATPILRVFAPLGVVLPAGLGLQIDDEEIGKAGFVRCIVSGCIAEVIMPKELIDKMSNGKTATFIIFETPEVGIGIPISLDGFAEGFEAIP